MPRYELPDGSKFHEVLAEANIVRLRSGRIEGKKSVTMSSSKTTYNAVEEARVACAASTSAWLAEGYIQRGSSSLDAEAKARGAAHDRQSALDAKRLVMISNLVDVVGVLSDCEEESEWASGMFSMRLVQLPSGRIDTTENTGERVDEASLRECKRLSAEAAAEVDELEVAGSGGFEPYQPFYVARSTELSIDKLDAHSIRRAFGKALYPKAEIAIEPLEEATEWWDGVLNLEDEDAIARYRSMREWFVARSEFVETAFVSIDKPSLDDPEGGVCFPRMVLGRTKNGGLAGLFGYVVWD